jgi:hypothetical protein
VARTLRIRSVRATSILLLVLSSFSVAAQQLDEFERVLIPAIAIPPVSGQNGARFASNVTLYAPNGTRFFPKYRQNADGSLTAEIGMQQPRTFPLFVATPPSRAGRFVFIEHARSAEAALHAALLSRAAEGATTYRARLPIVRENDFYSGAFSIAGIDSTMPFEKRHTLRVYDLDGHGEGVVRVRLFMESPIEELRMDRMLDIASREGEDPSYPYYAELDLPGICIVFSAHAPCLGGSQRVEITPLTPGTRVWAVVGETNNQTQEVMLLYRE